MYKLIKDQGTSRTITLNIPDKAMTISLGGVTIPMLEILREAGISQDDGTLGTLHDKWDLEIDKETANKLTKLTHSTTKPIRDQSKKAKEPKKSNKTIDAMDVLLGLAQYS